MGSVLLFSDVDGTVLDRHGVYALTPGELSAFSPAITLVLASSRTVLELSRNQRDLGITGPVVAENGAIVALPWQDALRDVGARETIDDREWCVIVLGATAGALRDDVRRAARATGVPYIDQEDVEPTLGRRCSVLLRPVVGAGESTLDPLADALRTVGRSVSSGGSWLAVTGGAEKGDGVRAITSTLDRLGMPYSAVAAVGDSDNDVSLLSAARLRFVISREDGTYHPALRSLPGVELMTPIGIAGWRTTLQRLTELSEVR